MKQTKINFLGTGTLLLFFEMDSKRGPEFASEAYNNYAREWGCPRRFNNDLSLTVFLLCLSVLALLLTACKLLQSTVCFAVYPSRATTSIFTSLPF